MQKRNVIVEAWVPEDAAPPDPDAHPEHPIYLPITPPGDVYPPGIWGGANEPWPTPPIFIPIVPPTDEYPPGIWGGGNEPFPTPPIYIPVPPPDPDLRPEHPIYWPVYPAHPIELPPEGGTPPEGPPDIELPPWCEWPDDAKRRLIEFLTGNLPPFQGPPSVQPV